MDESYKIITTKTDIPNYSNQVNKPMEFIIRFIEGTVIDSQLQDEIIDSINSDISIENKLNRQRLEHFRREFSTNLLKCLREQDFEYGIDTPADELVRKMFAENESVAKEWLNQLFVENYDDQTVIIGLLRVLSHFEYEEVAPQGPTMALAALSNASAEVRECGIRAFENWSNLESLRVLTNVKCEEEWLQDYLQQVIADIEEELGGNAIAG